MKITRVILKNFANIKTALKANELTIDFTKGKNKITLLTGPNGSGKTSILSCLHPFATNGNLDVRNDNSLVIIGKEGYKEIELIDGANTYLIKHFYSPNKDTHTTKSYIEKNGVELNVNGNVTSFKEILKEELDIEQDYLKLARLGNNVTNFIDMKTTDRKTFMGKILDDVNVYLKYFKKVNKDIIQMKSVISHIIDKISKLGISDKDSIENQLKKLQKTIKEDMDTLRMKQEELVIVNHEISQYDAPIIVKEALSLAKAKKDKITRVLSKKESENMTLEKCNEAYIEAVTRLSTEQVKLSNLIEKRFEILNQIDITMKDLDFLNKEIDKIINSSEINEMSSIIDQLKKDIEEKSRQYKFATYEANYTKKDLDGLIVSLSRCDDIILTLYECGKESIKKALNMMSLGESVEKYIEKRQNKIQKDRLQASCEYIFNELSKKLGKPKANCRDPESCEIAKFYDELYTLATEIPDIVIEDETFVTYTKMAYQNIAKILDIFKANSDMIQKLPENCKEVLSFQYVVSRIHEMKPLDYKESLYRELSIITEYEIYQENLKKLQELKDKKALLEKSLGNAEYFQTKKKETEEKLDSLKESLSTITDDISSLNHDIDSDNELVQELRELEDSIKEKDSVEEEISTLESIYSKLNELFPKKNRYTTEIDELSFSINKKESEYNDIDYRLKSYNQLTKDLNSYNESYDELELIKSALSAKEGIPLLYIQVYLESIQDITNDLLEIIYDGDLFIEEFNITADEFKIPYVTKNTSIKDACYASQGERSFISLALSFALIYESISKYNILLLDEIDATLDTKNREKFLQILETQIDMINGEQVFVISHNNMFNMYPVDIISLEPDHLGKEEIQSDNALANYLPIKLV